MRVVTPHLSSTLPIRTPSVAECAEHNISTTDVVSPSQAIETSENEFVPAVDHTPNVLSGHEYAPTTLLECASHVCNTPVVSFNIEDVDACILSTVMSPVDHSFTIDVPEVVVNDDDPSHAHPTLNKHNMVTRSKAAIFKPKLYHVQARKKAIGCKWLFQIKYNVDGSISWYKARLVVKGFMQVPAAGLGRVCLGEPVQQEPNQFRTGSLEPFWSLPLFAVATISAAVVGLIRHYHRKISVVILYALVRVLFLDGHKKPMKMGLKTRLCRRSGDFPTIQGHQREVLNILFLLIGSDFRGNYWNSTNMTSNLQSSTRRISSVRRWMMMALRYVAHGNQFYALIVGIHRWRLRSPVTEKFATKLGYGRGGNGVGAGFLSDGSEGKKEPNKRHGASRMGAAGGYWVRTIVVATRVLAWQGSRHQGAQYVHGYCWRVLSSAEHAWTMGARTTPGCLGRLGTALCGIDSSLPSQRPEIIDSLGTSHVPQQPLLECHVFP
ncbi:hypothetical protein GQ457_13G012140 [Hibiscus cannabinus]